MKYDNHDLIWSCPHCGRKNVDVMHSDPDAHFVSMICEHCGAEIEECLCDVGTIIPYKQEIQTSANMQKKGGKATLQKYGKSHFSKMGKKSKRRGR